jgi:hypothetical protein
MTEKTMAPCGCGDCTLCHRLDQTHDGSLPSIKNILAVEEPTVEEVLKKSREIIKSLRASPPAKLTVGDLSVCGSRNSRRNLADEMRKLDDWGKGLTVGDLSWVSARRYADKYE